MTLFIQWYDRDPETFKPIYEREHHGRIEGETAAECMKTYNEWRQNHDLNRFTISEIVCVYD